MSARKPDLDAPLPATLAGELRVVIGQLRRKWREQVQPGDITPSQMAVLSRLKHHGPASVTALAQAEGVRPQSMGATVAALQADGLVVGTPHPSDGRQTLLSLTPKCRALINTFLAAREDWLSHGIQARLSAAEQKKLAQAIHLLQRLVND